MRLLVTVAAACLALTPIVSTAATDPTWERWQSVSGVFDLGGPRSDGSLVVAGSGALYQLDAAGDPAPLSKGPNGDHPDPGLQAYPAPCAGFHVARPGVGVVPAVTFGAR